MAIGTRVALPFELSRTSPTARGPLSFFCGGFFCWGGISGSSSCAMLQAAKERRESAMTPVAKGRYKIFFPAARTKNERRAFVGLGFDFPGREIRMKIY